MATSYTLTARNVPNADLKRLMELANQDEDYGVLSFDLDRKGATLEESTWRVLFTAQNALGAAKALMAANGDQVPDFPTVQETRSWFQRLVGV